MSLFTIIESLVFDLEKNNCNYILVLKSAMGSNNVLVLDKLLPFILGHASSYERFTLDPSKTEMSLIIALELLYTWLTLM